ncbi:hypothetical protein AOLI_G00176480 [Acnodon oligacanthus]
MALTCLVLAIGTDFWYITDISKRENNSSVSLSSHSGLWRTCNRYACPYQTPFISTDPCVYNTDVREPLTHMTPCSQDIRVHLRRGPFSDSISISPAVFGWSQTIPQVKQPGMAVLIVRPEALKRHRGQIRVQKWTFLQQAC